MNNSIKFKYTAAEYVALYEQLKGSKRARKNNTAEKLFVEFFDKMTTWEGHETAAETAEFLEEKGPDYCARGNAGQGEIGVRVRVVAGNQWAQWGDGDDYTHCSLEDLIAGARGEGVPDWFESEFFEYWDIKEGEWVARA
ncbi:hypothetical protein [Roseateles albus]|uniref:Uncharacterized protein n=1 Tax=Roseateles albus TaxID=2987525 RepID=A0ABT5KEE6_9BURK|nr:hypothetical protein [Roseateles albus]MDC8771752.1 hypothetical protein [Roseateles albus]